MKIFNNSILVFFVVLINVIPLQSQDIKENLHKFFSYYNQNGMFNGVVLAAENGKVVFTKAYGFADFENKISLETSSVFAIGSITKPYTATAIMMLMERGLLSYDDKLVDFFPDFPSYANEITIRHLLTHNSGLVDYINNLSLLDKLPEVNSKSAYDSIICQPKLKSVPGERYSYSNSNYLLLGLIIQKVSGKTYREFIKENIFHPLDMDNSYVYDETVENIPGRVNPYAAFWEKTDSDIRHKANGCGNIYSTAYDQFLFDQALYTDKLVSQKTMQEAYDTTGLLDRRNYVYGYGWKIPINQQERIVYHNGSVGGFQGQLWRLLSEKKTLIILCNNTWISKQSDILSGAENIMLGKPFSFGQISAEELFYETWYMNGFDAGVTKLRQVYQNGFKKYYLFPYEINAIGYHFINRNEISQAIEIFKLSVEMYPDNYHLLDSLGEAYLKAGDKVNSAKYYNKALEINPDLETAKEALEIIKKMR